MNFHIDLSNVLNANSRIEQKIWRISITVLIALTAINTITAKETFIRLVYASMLVLMLIAVIYYRRVSRNGQLFIRSDAQMLEYKLGYMRYAKQQLLWESVARVKFGPTYIRFFKRTGRRKTLKLGWLPYDTLLRIKQQLMAACDEQNIAYEVAEFKKG